MITNVGRDNGYQDPPELTRLGIVDLDDELEATAIALHRMTFATPADAAGMFTSPGGREELIYSWRAQPVTERRLYRTRAEVALEVRARAAAAAASA